MEMILIIGILAFVIFAVGIGLTVTGFIAGPSEKDYVPRVDLSRLKLDLTQMLNQKEEMKSRLDQMAVKLDEANLQLAAEQKKGREAGEALKQTQELEEQYRMLAIREQEYESQIREVRQNFDFLRQKADTQAREAFELLQLLRDENEALQKKFEESKNRIAPEELNAVTVKNQELKKEILRHLAYIDRLKEEILQREARFSETAEESKKKISELMKANETLSGGVRDMLEKIRNLDEGYAEIMVSHQERFDADENRIETLKSENQTLEDQIRELQTLSSQTLPSEENFEDLKHLQEEIQILHNQVAENEDKMAELESQLEASRKEAKKGQLAFEELERVRQRTAQEAARTVVPAESAPRLGVDDIARLRLINGQLMTKIEILQEELLKNRTRAIGLEKICAEYKTIIEQRA